MKLNNGEYNKVEMSKTECCTNNVQSEDEKSCSNRFEVMDELNRHYSERITIFENAGCTERLVASLKKWIEALIKHDKILISTIESLESEAIARSEKLSYLCKDRIQVEEKCEKYKQEISEKTELIKELNTRLKEQCETLNQKEYAIKRLKEELDQLNKSIDNVKNKNNTCNNPQDSSISDMNSQLEKLKKELNEKESKIKSLEEDLCSCKQKLDSIKDSPENSKKKLRNRKSIFTTTDGDFERSYVKDLIDKLNNLECDINSKDEKLQDFSNKIEQLQMQLDNKTKELELHRLNDIPFIEEDDKQLEYQNMLQEKLKEKEKEIENLQKLLNEMKASGDSNVALLLKNLENLKRESRDMKEALTAEVAEKHDMITTLRRDTAQLEEKARQADMQAIFKDDIIKELRKEVKLARAKESFVEMLGLNEGSRVQMKAKIDSLSAELEEKQCEIISLENKLLEMNRHTLEGKLGDMSLQLMDRERDMIILCNKVDYIKRYLEKLHEDEDISIKCGLKALLLELNEETEWRRKARRSVTSLGDQPESVIIINRSNSLPADSSEVSENIEVFNIQYSALYCKINK